MRTRGNEAERLAQNWLTQKGCKILETNYHCRFGEIDIIASDNHDLCFIEVRYRKKTDFGYAAETVNRAKQMKIIKTAEYYLMQRAELNHRHCRFDIIAMQGEINEPQINWLKNAFTVAD